MSRQWRRNGAGEGTEGQENSLKKDLLFLSLSSFFTKSKHHTNLFLINHAGLNYILVLTVAFLQYKIYSSSQNSTAAWLIQEYWSGTLCRYKYFDRDNKLYKHGAGINFILFRLLKTQTHIKTQEC